MLVLERFGFAGLGFLRMQIVRLCEVDAPCVQQMGVLFFVSDTAKQIDMVQTDGSVVGQRILDQEVGIGTLILSQSLVALVQIDAVTLNPCRNPRLVLGVGLAVREVQLVTQLVVLVLE